MQCESVDSSDDGLDEESKRKKKKKDKKTKKEKKEKKSKKSKHKEDPELNPEFFNVPSPVGVMKGIFFIELSLFYELSLLKRCLEDVKLVEALNVAVIGLTI